MDDLLDLNFSSSKPIAPSKPAHLKSSAIKANNDPWLSSGLLAPQAASKTGSSSSTSRQQSSFDSLLSSTSINGKQAAPSPAFGRSSTPSTASRSSTPVINGSGSITKTSADAFSSLLSLDASSRSLASAAPQKQSLAERQAQHAREAKEREEKERAAFDFSSWGASSPLGSGSSSARHLGATAVPKATPGSKGATIGDFGIFDSQPPRQTAPARTQPNANSKYHSSAKKATPNIADFGIFDDEPSRAASPSQASKRAASSPSSDPTADWFAEFGSATPDQSSSATSHQDRPPQRPDTNGSSASPRRPAGAHPSSAFQGKRSSSPPPHIIGQLVEMGFSPSQARQALSKTDSGTNVEAALELLLRDAPPASATGDRLQSRDVEDDAAERRRRRRQGPSRATLDKPDARSEASLSSAGAPVVNLQTDKLLSQASEIGLNMFSKANSLWNTGKERAQKLYEERAAALQAENARRSGNASPANHDARPRWMVQAEEEEEREERQRAEPSRTRKAARAAPAAAFQDSDDDDDEEGPEEATGRGPTERQALSKQAPTPARLFDNDSRPARRSTPRPAAATQPSIRKKVRPTVLVEPSRLQQSLALRNKGNETFKLGRFGEAIEQYTAALDALPPQHLLRIPLWNNRAAAHLKQGEHESAARDCTDVITLIGLDYHPAKEEPPKEESSEVQLPEALFKALSKRASAYEMAEKWDKAKVDWEFLMGSPVAAVVFAGGPQHRKMVSDGLARSKKMLAPTVAPKPSVAKAPIRAPKAPSSKPTVAPRASEGVTKMRQAAAAAESEDNLRLQLKDSVDSKITMWSGGKTTNLRALLGSLDMVLWPELALKKVSMADLIAEKQVKIAYMRVIGKLHPDKLNPSNTTVEQRMIANAVFGILNEAWQAFQSGA